MLKHNQVFWDFNRFNFFFPSWSTGEEGENRINITPHATKAFKEGAIVRLSVNNAAIGRDAITI
jgi:hypothetical protein